jgi:hypothetical protein
MNEQKHEQNRLFFLSDHDSAILLIGVKYKELLFWKKWYCIIFIRR